MDSYRTDQVIAASFAMCGFSVAVVAGVAVGNPASLVLTRGLVAMGVCFLLGKVAGRVALVAVRAHLARYQKEHTPRSGKLVEEYSEADFVDESEEIGASVASEEGQGVPVETARSAQAA